MIQPKKVAALLQDATQGMSPDDVSNVTGIPVASWYRYRKGDIPMRNRAVILTQLSKLGIPVEDLVTALEQSNNKDTDYEQMVREVLAATPISPDARVRLMKQFREELEKQQAGTNRHAA